MLEDLIMRVVVVVSPEDRVAVLSSKIEKVGSAGRDSAVRAMLPEKPLKLVSVMMVFVAEFCLAVRNGAEDSIVKVGWVGVQRLVSIIDTCMRPLTVPMLPDPWTVSR